jgi:hypothetical protein
MVGTNTIEVSELIPASINSEMELSLSDLMWSAKKGMHRTS